MSGGIMAENVDGCVKSSKGPILAEVETSENAKVVKKRCPWVRLVLEKPPLTLNSPHSLREDSGIFVSQITRGNGSLFVFIQMISPLSDRQN
jgi:hypothetical protein